MRREEKKMRQTVKNDTAKEIKRGGFADVNQILESLVPGLYVSTKTERADRTRMSLNGGGINQIVFLLDGVRINNRLYGDGNLDTLSTAMIERIEILKNGEGLFYGTDGVAGVINIITKIKPLLRYEAPAKTFGGDIASRYIGKIASGSFYSERYDTYYGENWLTDVSFFYRFGQDLAHMFTLRLNNLFDDQYVTYGHSRATDSYTEEKFLYGFRGAPRTVMLSYKFTF